MKFRFPLPVLAMLVVIAACHSSDGIPGGNFQRNGHYAHDSPRDYSAKKWRSQWLQRDHDRSISDGEKTRIAQFLPPPTVADGKVYWTTRDDIVAHSVSNGTQVWRKQIFARFPTTAHDGVIYVVESSGKLIALKTSNGDQVWEFDPESQVATLPVIRENLLVVSTREGEVYGLDRLKGTIVWERDSDGAGFDLGTSLASDAVLVASVTRRRSRSRASLFGLDPGTGLDKWKLQPQTAYDRRVDGLIEHEDVEEFGSFPTVSGDSVFITDGRKSVYALDLVTQKQLWFRHLRDGTLHPGLAASDSLLFVPIGNELRALNSTTGRDAWSYTLRDWEEANGPLIVGKRVYITTNDGRIIWLDIDSGRQLGEFQILASALGSAAISDGVLFVHGVERTGNGVVASVYAVE